MFERLLAFWRGRVYFLACGERLADFINEAIRDRIMLYQVQRSEKGMRAQVSLGDFKRMRRAARKSHSHLRIIAKYGWPFIAIRWWRRKGLLAGLFIIGITLISLSQMILSISISGNKTIDSKIIFEHAASQGLKTWIWQREVDPNKVAAVLQEQIPDAAWVGIERTGTHIEITIVEKIHPKIPSEAGNLVASKPGMVQEVIVIQGQPQIHEGETVRAGQLLIAQAPALSESTGKNSQQTAAKGFVRGRVWYSGEVAVPLIEDKVKETGRLAKGWGIKIGSRVIMITTPNSPFSQVNQEVVGRPLLSWRNWRFPVEVINIRYKELFQEHTERSASEAQQLAENLARNEVYKKIPKGVAIIEEAVKVMPHADGQEKVRVEVETYEDLAVYADP